MTVHAKRAVSGTWDRRSLEAVIGTMLSNAIKYGAGKPVDLTVDGDRARARVHVQDRGIGISPEEQARIFERFERAVPEQHYGGLGLGLWVVRQMVEAHHGTVRVDSRPGEGSTFTVELPTEPGILRPAAVPKWLRRHWLGVKRAWMRRDTLSR